VPRTSWLPEEIVRDEAGFIRTGQDGRLLLETSMEGVFAVGDVRSGSVKRVATAVGDGATVIALLHGYLAAHPAPTA
jgi:thioredoxin reductase (NADPH)